MVLYCACTRIVYLCNKLHIFDQMVIVLYMFVISFLSNSKAIHIFVFLFCKLANEDRITTLQGTDIFVAMFKTSNFMSVMLQTYEHIK